MRNAVIYARVSQDRSGQQKSVEQQVKESREECDRRGWTVRDVITDNSISASRYTTKQRPGYRSLLTGLREGEVLVVWEPSRTTRKMEDHLELRSLCEAKGILFCAGSDLIDFSKSSDRFSAGVRAQVDEYASDQTRDRVLRDTKDRAVKGRPHGDLGFGFIRRYDTEKGSVTYDLHSEQALLIRELCDRILAGESTYSISREWNARGVPTPGTGKLWRPQQLRQLILKPSLAGLRQYRGEVIGCGNWPSIITEDEHQRLSAVLRDPQRRTTDKMGRKPIHLLSGIAECSVCGDTLRWTRDRRKAAQYRCEAGHVSRRDEMIEAVVLERMFPLIEAWRDDEFLMADDDGAKSAECFAEARVLQQRLDVAADLYADGKISATTLARTEANLAPQIEKLNEQGRAATSDPALARLSENAEQKWAGYTTEERRRLLKAALRIRVSPMKDGGRILIEPRTEFRTDAMRSRKLSEYR